MIFGLDGIEIALLIVFFTLFSAIMSGYPVAFAIGGSAVVSFGLLALLDGSGLLTHAILDKHSAEFAALIRSGVSPDKISVFTHPDLSTIQVPLFDNGAMGALTRTLTFIVNRMNERVFAGASIETLLAVAMFVLMGIALERSRIANDLLITMARIFGPMPGGLAISVVIVGAFLAASTGIVGATVVTMGLLSLPTMLRHKYSPELATGVIAASGTLGQIIPPSIVIVLLGTLTGDIYATAQEERALSVGCSDALTYLGEAAVLSVGTLFKAAIVPGIFLAFLYALYAFGYALWKPEKAPAIHFERDEGKRQKAWQMQQWIWVIILPFLAVMIALTAFSFHLAGHQEFTNWMPVERFAPELRTNVSEKCKTAMITLHGEEKWNRSVIQRNALKEARNDQSKGKKIQLEIGDIQALSDADKAYLVSLLPPLSSSTVVMMMLVSMAFMIAFGLYPTYSPYPLFIGGVGAITLLLFDFLFVGPFTSPGKAAILYGLPILAILYGLKYALPRLAQIDLLRVVFPPLILIIAVLGSILGGITNPTPAAALGAAGALMLAAHRRLSEREEKAKTPLLFMATLAIIVFLLIGIHFDLRTGIEIITFENWVAIIVAIIAYHVAFAGLLYACYVLWRDGILTPIVRETAKVTSMVFVILIGSQMLNLVLISFGGEEYIQLFLKSFQEEWTVFLMVMLILFLLGFVLDFLEIIYIVIPIVGPVIYGGTLDPKWVTILIAINLQTSFLTPPFGFALFYLRGVAPASIKTTEIYRGVIPFVIIQILMLIILWYVPNIVTWLPNLLR